MVKRAKRTTKPVKPRTAIEAIRQLRATFLGLDAEERSKLWDVLTALRGCDLDQNDTLKFATTAVIRAAVFGEAPDGFHRAMFTYTDTDALVAKRVKDYHESKGTFHFKNHSEWAFTVLGLKWNENNGEIKPV